jgi:hypothetical protein
MFRVTVSVAAKLLLPVMAASALFAPGCGGNNTPAEFDDNPPAAPAQNPDGVPYPTDNIGTTARAGKLPGKRIENLSFQGYLNSDRAAGLKVISMADFFDPGAKRYKLIAIQAAATWCTICMAETRDTVALQPEYSQKGVVFLQTIINGPTNGFGPSLLDVEGWMDKHGTNFTVLIDVRGKRSIPLGAQAVPWNARIDPRTMEILDQGTGIPRNLAEYIDEGLNFVAKAKPSYPL